MGVKCKVSNRKILLSGKIFCFREKRLPSIFKFCASSNLLFFFELLIGYFPVIRLVSFVQVPVIVVAL